MVFLNFEQAFTNLQREKVVVMGEKEFNAVVEILLQQVVALVVNRKGLPIEDALLYVYESRLYVLLTREDTKLWHLSVEKLYQMLVDEREKNILTLPDYV